MRTTIEMNKGANNANSTECPVLLVEEDCVSGRDTHPPARRESYRHLFSRLRSG
jgi:hypothetical protein